MVHVYLVLVKFCSAVDLEVVYVVHIVNGTLHVVSLLL